LRILILKPSSLGDVVQALPVLRLLKSAQPHHEIFWWIDSRLVDLLTGDPDLTGLLPFERQAWSGPFGWPGAWRSVRHIQALQFDLVLDLQALARSAALAWFSRARWRIGLEDGREGAAAIYHERIPRPSPHTHAVDWYLQVLRHLRVPIHWDFDWLPQRTVVRDAVLRRWGLTATTPLVLLQPGGRWENKRWPLERYRQVTQRLAERFPALHFGILGSTAERSLGQSLAGLAPGRVRDLTGQTGLWEMVELIRHAAVLVCNDSGPMHVAAAIGKPVVTIFGPTDPRRTGPYGQSQRVLRHPGLPCAPCLRSSCAHTPALECLTAISPEAVIAATHQLLGADS